MGNVRKFDHDKARELAAAGVASTEIAQRLGVTHQAVNRVLESPEKRAENLVRHREWQRQRYQRPCATLDCDRTVWVSGTQGTGVCARCTGMEHRTAEHGSEARYRRCRCEVCRAGAAAARRRRRAADPEQQARDTDYRRARRAEARHARDLARV